MSAVAAQLGDNDRDALAWAAAIIQREQKNLLFGEVSFHFQNGVVTTAKIIKSEKPPG